MEQSSRTINVARNSMVAVTTKIINMFLAYIVRTIFIYFLGKEYLGVNGLFTNILTLLSFAELGIGNAIIFSLYKPIAENDTEKIKSLMRLYLKCYRCIGFFIIAIGLILTPFIPYLIKNGLTIDINVYLVFLLYLVNTACTYFFSSRQSYLIACQKQYKVDIYLQIAKIVKEALLALTLILTGNFMVYLVSQVVFELLINMIIYLKIGKDNPILREKNVVKLPKDELMKIITNVSALMIYKFCIVVLNGTDNIIISSFIGIVDVGILSNYTLIVNSIQSLTTSVTNSFTSSLGNLNAGNDTKKQELVFNSIVLISFWLFGYISLGLFLFLNDFITIWLGQSYLFPTSVVFAICLNFYVGGMQTAGHAFRVTKGYFKQSKWFPLINVFINIGLSLFLLQYFGVFGVLIATPISRIITVTLVDPYFVYKLSFKKSPFIFYTKYVLFFLILTVIYFINIYCLNLIALSGVLGFAVKFVVYSIITNIIMFFIFYKTDSFKFVVEKIKFILLKRKGK